MQPTTPMFRSRQPLIVALVLVLASLACVGGLGPSGPDINTGNTDGESPSVEEPTPEPETPAEDPAGEPTPTEDQPAATPTTPSERPSELSPEQIDLIVSASVQILAANSAVGGNFQPLWTGSGTIFNEQGEILTNCHVACDAPVLVILMSTTADRPPEPRYLAEITFADPDLDLAIVRITADIDGNAVNPTDLNLPFIPLGNSDDLRLGDPIRVFGYPGVGGSTITFTSGSVSGFSSSDAGDRIAIKTDADIASGNSGGTAVDLFGRLVGVPTLVNPDVRDGVTIGGIGILRPVNLLDVLRGQPAAPPSPGAGIPEADPDPFEPNETIDQAAGPLVSGELIEAFISWERDLDVYYFDVTTTQPITVELASMPPGTDYDIFLAQPGAGEEGIVDQSASTNPTELIQFTPPAPGRYYVVVVGYEGSNSPTTPYQLIVTYDGGPAPGGAPGGPSDGAGVGGIVISGRAIDAPTGRPLAGGIFGVIQGGFTCRDLFGGTSQDLDPNLVSASAETDSQGFFEVVGVPRDGVYSAFFVFGSDYICEDQWLTVPFDAIDTDLGDIEMSF